MEYNVYCDESCHLENDGQKVMVLGAIWCPLDKRLEIAKRIREIKVKHNLPATFEVKWTKVSSSKLGFYMDLLDFFFDDDDLHFRGLVADKTKLDHGRFNQDHDDWYYKMYFTMLKAILEPQSQYRIYIDIKDTLGHEKITRLHKVLCNTTYDFSQRIIKDVKRIHSHEAEQLQLADLLIGALAYLHRDLNSNNAKVALINRIKERSCYSLKQTTLARENKFNLLVWDSMYG
ncbi:DUF3800 domain-containing protein [Parashewanella spongiae]|uniref:DUF3800 domain-containing protein n=1 Tax=Parashewanella spongiae TaxID=342950 RepID=A0A3A6TLG0_9GAMM|nr:DUF3800 domain-containing protein [Parashewanella spongiae]MCL1078805.1 DUF3800 domain-containing protein [Parashewanella spongiae]RJY11941.1 DUF3800 domain-containing protein [Parashewanella spongiae]